MENRITKARALISLCDKNLRENEHNIRKLKGISMSRSDVEVARLYGETILREGTYLNILMPPRGEVSALLNKLSLLEG